MNTGTLNVFAFVVIAGLAVLQLQEGHQDFFIIDIVLCSFNAAAAYHSMNKGGK